MGSLELLYKWLTPITDIPGGPDRGMEEMEKDMKRWRKGDHRVE